MYKYNSCKQLCTQYFTCRPKIPSAEFDLAPQTETTTACLAFCINPSSMILEYYMMWSYWCHVRTQIHIYSHAEQTAILRLPSWDCHLETVILRPPSWDRHLETAILRPPSWDHHLETAIVRPLSWNRQFETSILRLPSWNQFFRYLTQEKGGRGLVKPK